MWVDKSQETGPSVAIAQGGGALTRSWAGLESAGDGFLNSPRHQVFWKSSLD